MMLNIDHYNCKAYQNDMTRAISLQIRNEMLNKNDRNNAGVVGMLWGCCGGVVGVLWGVVGVL